MSVSAASSLTPDDALRRLLNGDDVEEVNLACPIAGLGKLEEVVRCRAAEGHVDAVLKIIELKGNPEAAPLLFNSALQFAAYTNQRAFIETLVQMAERGTLPYKVAPLAPCMLPAIAESFRRDSSLFYIPTLLLDFCLRTNDEEERKGYELVRKLIYRDRVDLLEILLERGREGFLIGECFLNCVDVIQKLKKTPLPPEILEARNKSFDEEAAKTQLHFAVVDNDIEKVKWVNDQFSLLQIRDMASIMRVAGRIGRVAVVPTIIELCEKRQRNILFHEAFSSAVTAGEAKAVEILLESAPQIDVRPFRLDILRAIVVFFKEKQFDVLKQLLAFGESSQQGYERSGYLCIRNVIEAAQPNMEEIASRTDFSVDFFFCAEELAKFKKDADVVS